MHPRQTKFLKVPNTAGLGIAIANREFLYFLQNKQIVNHESLSTRSKQNIVLKYVAIQQPNVYNQYQNQVNRQDKNFNEVSEGISNI